MSVINKTVKGLLLALLSGLSLQANAILLTADIEFDTNQSLVGHKESIGMNVDFGGAFDNINRLTFVFEFVGDLLDSGDHFRFGWFPGDNGSSYAYGAINFRATSQSSRTLSLTANHGGVDNFLDGIQSFNFSMLNGSVNLSNAYVTADGGFIAQVSEPGTGFLLLLGIVAMFGKRVRNLP